jgi:hypothetical protein
MNKYRAVLIDPGNSAQERPLQIFGNDLPELKNWAVKVLRSAISPLAVVNIYQTLEQHIAMIPKAKLEDKPQ